MNVHKQVTMGVVVVMLALLMVGCVSKSKYEALDERYSALLSSSKQEMETLDEKLTHLVRQYDMLEQDYTRLRRDYDTLGQNYTRLQSDADMMSRRYSDAMEKLREVERLESQFVSLDALLKWLRESNVNRRVYVTGVFECEEFARSLAGEAEDDGYFIGLLDVDVPDCAFYWPDGSCFSSFYDLHHALNWVVIAGVLYIVEPQTDEVWLSNEYLQLMKEGWR